MAKSFKVLRVELDKAAIRSVLLESQETLSLLRELAGQVQQKCGSGYEVREHPTGRTRASVTVYAETQEARRDNLKNNTLLRSIGQ